MDYLLCPVGDYEVIKKDPGSAVSSSPLSYMQL